MIALDTNILIYADSPDDQQGRYHRALEIIEQTSRIQNCLPVQVLCEFLNVCRRKKTLDMPAAIQRVDGYADLFQTQGTLLDDVEQAAQLSQMFDLQYFDAIIIAVAQRAGATVLLSEGMHDGLEIDGLRIVNPFMAGNDAKIAEALD